MRDGVRRAGAQVGSALRARLGALGAARTSPSTKRTLRLHGH